MAGQTGPVAADANAAMAMKRAAFPPMTAAARRSSATGAAAALPAEADSAATNRTPSGTTNGAVAGVAFSSAAANACARCGEPIVRRRRNQNQDPALCVRCDQRARRSAYFRNYYLSHRDRILDKNRRWARDNKDKIVELRQARLARQPKHDEAPRHCVECGTPVVRAERCRRCYIRFRYASDPEYRRRRLATTRRWIERRQSLASRAQKTKTQLS